MIADLSQIGADLSQIRADLAQNDNQDLFTKYKEYDY